MLSPVFFHRVSRVSGHHPVWWQLSLGRLSQWSARLTSNSHQTQVMVHLTGYLCLTLCIPRFSSGARFDCHPRMGRTLSLLGQHFWWPTMATDTQDFVTACTVCARGKSSHRPLAGFLRPLPIPSRPWSHIALDFVSGLPDSSGKNSCINNC